ncbi:molybdenum cofactor biosynthesis protein MoaE [Sphingomonas koreensis]|uniref:molybdenum cofactor biosynthesis protein MoaE n=1 Tax=Sphingomonas koreensis TaxID=93064 RepID=UPI00082FE738|nr:molybdenum cofactor biosynthesis protein MoaE [Sphingomonas koreensis]PJI86936.1 molybdopterin synthase catalytic subunit [Sphingomonas koreensis]RSU60657.1 molybdenum cofactor biosynthesis protein MoaE [Sphingomonas koreensis]RSU69551.1 molybdenum cofactor biosynthesis protein MoaE [Sphingomonas koreensis]
MIRVSVDHAPIDIGTEMAGIEETGAGAVASFTGIVRADDGVTAMELEHYPGMTEAVLCDLAEQAMARWGLLSAVIVHRVGQMVPGDRVVLVATAATHRRQALDACAFLIDRLKTDAPFWKREARGEASRWVEARASDDQAAARWTGPDDNPD